MSGGVFSVVCISKTNIPSGVSTEYQLHKHVWSLFNGTGKLKRPFLFRKLDDGRHAIVVSSESPVSNLSYVEETKKVDPAFVRDGKYSFVLRVNPVKRSVSDGNIVPLRGDDAVLWLRRKMEGIANVEKVTGMNESDITFRKGVGSEKVFMHVVDFEGVIKCLDPAGIRSLFENGVGRGKSFGMGLLLLRRIS